MKVVLGHFFFKLELFIFRYFYFKNKYWFEVWRYVAL